MVILTMLLKPHIILDALKQNFVLLKVQCKWSIYKLLSQVRQVKRLSVRG